MSRSAESSWAHVLEATPVRAHPAARSRVLARLGTATYEGKPETVVVLGRARSDPSWSLVRYPQPGSRRGWVRTSALGRLHHVRTRIVIDRAAKRLIVFERGRRVRAFDVGVGAPRSPTPRGTYYVREKLVPRDRRGLYGARAIGTSAYSRFRTDWPGGGQVGIHGTNRPELIPGRPSNGCVRLRSRDVVALYARAKIGTPIVVR